MIHRHDDHGCLITILLLIVAWPLAILYWIVRMVGWILGSVIDWMTFGPVRRRRRQ